MAWCMRCAEHQSRCWLRSPSVPASKLHCIATFGSQPTRHASVNRRSISACCPEWLHHRPRLHPDVRRPFSSEAVVAEFATLAKSYGLRKVTGDRYGGERPREQFRNRGLTYEVAQHTRSDLYLSLVSSTLGAFDCWVTSGWRCNLSPWSVVQRVWTAIWWTTVTILSINMEGRVRVREDAPRARVLVAYPGINAL